MAGDAHREVQIFLYRPVVGGPDVLVFHRSPDSGGYWHTVAGAVESGETDPEAAVREVLEETGFDACGCISELDHEYQYRTVSGRSFAVEVPAGWAPRLNDEHDGYRWCGVAEAVRLLHWRETAEAVLVLARILTEGR
jgi:8-oxo-dGTP pyrophosphatase MutT (NUDIX family)